MSLENMPKEMLSDLTKFLAHMPMRGDAALSILKGHLLVEELIWHLIKSKVKAPSELEKVRFSFDHAACLARALAGESEENWVWPSIKKLNQLRNKLAHNLEPADLDLKLKEFYSLVQSGIAKHDHSGAIEIVGELHWYISMLYMALSARLHVKPKSVLAMGAERVSTPSNNSFKADGVPPQP